VNKQVVSSNIAQSHAQSRRLGGVLCGTPCAEEGAGSNFALLFWKGVFYAKNIDV